MQGSRDVLSSTQTHSESLSILTDHGHGNFNPMPSRYVIHTSTIPLATTMDRQFVLRGTNVQSPGFFHGFLSGKKSEAIFCPKSRCMYTRSKDRSRCMELVSDNCPCRTVTTPEGNSLQPLCFMTFLKALNSNLVGRLDEDHQAIIPSQVMYCQDSNGILDNSYPGPARDRLNVTSWGHIRTPMQLERVLGLTYWYRKYAVQYRIPRLIRDASSRMRFGSVRLAVSQSLHTLNGLLLKKFFVFGPELTDYRSIAEQTARMFRDLFEDYVTPPKEVDGVYVQQETTYAELKDLFNKCKETFHRGNTTARCSWLETDFRARSIGSFFGTEFRRLIATVNLQLSTLGSDYTESPAWIFRCTTFSQVRVMGYLPLSIAEVKRQSYRATVNRPIDKLSMERNRLIQLSVQHHLYQAGIPLSLLKREDKSNKAMFDKALDAIQLTLKPSASVDSTVSSGGKLEDARLLIQRAKQNHWSVPIRDLRDHSIIEMIEIDTLDSDVENWSRFLFWASYQIVINFWIRWEQWPNDDYHRLPDGDGDYYEDVLQAQILHISEPGKERNLTKSKSTYTWLLTPAGKLSQAVLAELPEHRAGLELAAHDWIHTRRISAESTESGFVYDQATGRVRQPILQVFKDWTESTDFIGKHVGLAHLSALWKYIDFWPMYARLCKQTIIAPQPVREVIMRSPHDDPSISAPLDERRIEWHGAIREGYMMGNPLTKTILHLIHVSELEIVIKYLDKRGIQLNRGQPGSLFLERPRIPRTTDEGAKVTRVLYNPAVAAARRALPLVHPQT